MKKIRYSLLIDPIKVPFYKSFRATRCRIPAKAWWRAKWALLYDWRESIRMGRSIHGSISWQMIHGCWWNTIVKMVSSKRNVSDLTRMVSSKSAVKQCDPMGWMSWFLHSGITLFHSWIKRQSNSTQRLSQGTFTLPNIHCHCLSLAIWLSGTQSAHTRKEAVAQCRSLSLVVLPMGSRSPWPIQKVF